MSHILSKWLLFYFLTTTTNCIKTDQTLSDIFPTIIIIIASEVCQKCGSQALMHCPMFTRHGLWWSQFEPDVRFVNTGVILAWLCWPLNVSWVGTYRALVLLFLSVSALHMLERQYDLPTCAFSCCTYVHVSVWQWYLCVQTYLQMGFMSASHVWV